MRATDALLLAAALAAGAVGCGESGPPPESGGGDPASAGADLSCGELDHPCTWSEVDPAVRQRTDAVGRLAARLMVETGSPDSVARFLRRADGVAEVQWGGLAVRFRLEGGRAGWIYAPFDLENPRLGGAPSPGRPLQDSPSGDRVAGEPGSEKSALVVSPFEWQAGKTRGVVSRLRRARDYRRPDGSVAVTHRANLSELFPNPADAPISSVTLDDFLSWDDHDLVYLATHGARVCPDGAPLESEGSASTAAGCHTTLMVGQYVHGAAGPEILDLGYPGLEVIYTLSNLAPGLQDDQADHCVRAIDRGVADPRIPSTGEPCLADRQLPYGILAVTTDFFRWAYPDGLEDMVLFLAACQSLMAGDLVDHFTAGRSNDDIAVFGYDGAVYSDQAAIAGREFADLVVDGLDSEEIRGKLTIMPAFTGVVLGPGGEPGELVETSSTPTHAVDVAELVNSITGEPLQDGGTVALHGTRADGVPDSLGVRMRVHGVAGRIDPAEIELAISVDDRGVGPPTVPERQEEEYLWTVDDERTATGRDLSEDAEIVDLTVRAALPEEGRSRWTYEDVRLSGCWFRLEYAGARSGVAVGHRVIHQTRDGLPDWGPTARFWLAAPDDGVALTLSFQDPGLERGATGSWSAGVDDGWGMTLSVTGTNMMFRESRPEEFGGPRPFQLTITENDWDRRIRGRFQGVLWKHRYGDIRVRGEFVWKRGACSFQ